jgi:tetratricopeptide (TPR) repeat protein
MTILNKEKILEQARAFIDEGKFDRAIREYEKILLADPSDLRIKLRVAELYTKRKQVTDAIRIYREVADAYEEEGFFLKAVTVNKNVLRLNPSMIDVNEKLAVLYEKMGLTADAVRQYGILAATLDGKGMADKVLEIRKRVVSIVPDDTSSRIKLAEVFQREGKTDEAIEQYEELARQYDESGKNNTKLADLLEKILSHKPDDRKKMVKLIDLYVSLGDKKKALKWLDAGGELVDKDPRLLRLSAEIYKGQNQNETARNKYMLLAEIHKQKKDVEGALDAYLQILTLFPDEDERLGDLVEEIRPGAMPGLVKKAEEARKAMEAAEIVANTAAEAREAKVPAEKEAPKAPEKRPPPQEMRPKAREQSISDLVADELDSAKAPRPTPEKVSPKERISLGAADLKRADASYNLATAYGKMGLAKESRTEFEKALAIYEVMSGLPGVPASVAARVDEIRKKFGIETKRPPAPQKKPAEARPPKNTVEASPSKKDNKPQVEKKAEGDRGKKKISFV